MGTFFETQCTDKRIVYARNMESGSEDEVFQELKQLADIVYRFRLQRGSKFIKIRKALFVNLRPLDM